MDLSENQEDKELVLPSKDENKEIVQKCSDKSFNIGEFVDQQHEKCKHLQCYVKANERNYNRRLRNLFFSLIITLMLIVFVNFGLEIFKTWYFDGYDEYDFDYIAEFWSNLGTMLLIYR